MTIGLQNCKSPTILIGQICVQFREKLLGNAAKCADNMAEHAGLCGYGTRVAHQAYTPQ